VRVPRAAVPSALTLLCMAAGYAAIAAALYDQFALAAYLILFAHFLDNLDGRVARLLNATSRFGAELDSFSDVTTFAIAPAVLVQALFLRDWGAWGVALSFVMAAAGAVRLARFNLVAADGPSDSFVGLPSPVAASLVAGWVPFSYALWGEYRYPAVAAGLLLLAAALMVSPFSFQKAPPLTPARLRTHWKDRIYLAAVVSVLVYPSVGFFVWSWVYVLHGLLTRRRARPAP
jgi:CDP-diacylglycerol--serine O-phosphatidyltransferase